MDNKEVFKKLEDFCNSMADAIKKTDEGMKEIYVALNELIEYNRKLIKPTN